MPFVPLLPEDQFILVEDGDSTIIPCRTSDPNAQVALIDSEAKVVYAYYDSKQGFLGNFPAGSYTCQTTVKGMEFKSDQFFIYIWKGTLSNFLKEGKNIEPDSLLAYTIIA